MREGWPNPDSARIDQFTAKNNGHWDNVQLTSTFEEYIDRVSVPQVKEILSNYGEIAVLWWDTPTNMTDEAALKLQKLLDLQPNIITNDRLKRPNFPGDTRTPEQKIPGKDELAGQNWETCMTMNGSWGWRDDNKWKSTETLIRNLVDIASKGGNYLLNVGPKPDGTFPEQSIDRLNEIGRWMKTNGEGIYNTKAGPFGNIPWGRCTVREFGNRLIYYFFVFDWPTSGEISIPGFNEKVRDISVLGLKEKPLTSVDQNGLRIQLPSIPPNPMASTVKVVVKR
jgi:alpha-L-fucosidase